MTKQFKYKTNFTELLAEGCLLCCQHCRTIHGNVELNKQQEDKEKPKEKQQQQQQNYINNKFVQIAPKESADMTGNGHQMTESR